MKKKSKVEFVQTKEFLSPENLQNFLDQSTDSEAGLDDGILAETAYEAVHGPSRRGSVLYNDTLDKFAKYAIADPQVSLSFSLTDMDDMNSVNSETYNSLQFRLYSFLDRPSSSKGAFVYQIFLQFGVIGTIIILCMESFESLIAQDNWDKGLFYVDMIITIIFTLDYFSRLILYPGACRAKKKFILNPFNVIDFLSILPFYLELALSTQVVSVMRVVRLFRILKLIRLAKFAKYFKEGHILVEAVRRAAGGIVFLVLLLILLSVFFGSLMYFAETFTCFLDDNHIWIYKEGPVTGLPTYFQNIPLGMYWAIVTMVTVGYGDAFPFNWLGRGVGVLTIMCGVIVLGFPIVIIGSSYLEVQKEYNAHVKQIREENYNSGTQVQADAAPLTKIKSNSHHCQGPTLKQILKAQNKEIMVHELENLLNRIYAMEQLRESLCDAYLKNIKI